MYVCMHVCMYACMCVSMHLCIGLYEYKYTRTHIYIYIYMYLGIHKQQKKNARDIPATHITVLYHTYKNMYMHTNHLRCVHI